MFLPWHTSNSDVSWNAVLTGISGLHNLTVPDLSGSGFANLPAEIGNLTELNLSGNNSSGLPPEIGNLTNLTDIGLEYSFIELGPEVCAALMRDVRGVSIDSECQVVATY